MMRPTEMTRRRRLVPTALLTLIAVMLATAPATGIPAAASPPTAVPTSEAASPVRVDPQVWEEIDEQGKATFWVYLKETADLSEAPTISDWEERGHHVYDRLTATAAHTQRSVARLLTRHGAEWESYWITNALLVTGDADTLATLARRHDISEIAPDAVVRLGDATISGAQPGVSAIEWNIERVRAPDVWAAHGTGQGIVVATIDTGVRYTHQALVGSYRGTLGGGEFDHDYNWWSFDDCTVPCDDQGHGTHTMGTIVGDDGGANRIGVAPGARWIAARACTANGLCNQQHLLAAAQWILAPTTLAGTNPQQALRPHIVSNSWGGDPDHDEWFREMVQAWVAAGIFPVFSAGNKGPGCQTAENPGSLPDSYAVGAFDEDNQIASFSSRGLSAFGVVKPDITAPGVAIRSAVNSSNTAYAIGTGSSMAAPHVAGAVALLWSAFPAYQHSVAATRQVLDQSALPVADLSCGGTSSFNNVWGRGRLDVKAAIDLAASASGPVPPVGLVDPTQGRWHLRNSAGQVTSFYFGNPGDLPFVGDWNCNGIRTPGLYRQSDGFVYLRNANTQGVADITFFLGNPGDVPIAGDFNGNGCDTVSVYRPSTQTFYIVNTLGQDGGGLGAAETSYVFGNPGDTPFTGDFNGDGRTTVGLHRASTGLVYYRNSHTQGVADNQFLFGNPGDRFVAGDWNADGVDSPGVFRPSTTTFYFRHTNSQGVADAHLIWGQPGWLPVAGPFGLG
jgi:subtilisin family serine protease